MSGSDELFSNLSSLVKDSDDVLNSRDDDPLFAPHDIAPAKGESHNDVPTPLVGKEDEDDEEGKATLQLGVADSESLAKVLCFNKENPSKSVFVSGVCFASAVSVEHRTFYLFTRGKKERATAVAVEKLKGEFFDEQRGWSVNAALIPMSEGRIGALSFILLTKSDRVREDGKHVYDVRVELAHPLITFSEVHASLNPEIQGQFSRCYDPSGPLGVLDEVVLARELKFLQAEERSHWSWSPYALCCASRDLLFKEKKDKIKLDLDLIKRLQPVQTCFLSTVYEICSIKEVKFPNQEVLVAWPKAKVDQTTHWAYGYKLGEKFVWVERQLEKPTIAFWADINTLSQDVAKRKGFFCSGLRTENRTRVEVEEIQHDRLLLKAHKCDRPTEPLFRLEQFTRFEKDLDCRHLFKKVVCQVGEIGFSERDLFSVGRMTNLHSKVHVFLAP